MIGFYKAAALFLSSGAISVSEHDYVSTDVEALT